MKKLLLLGLIHCLLSGTLHAQLIPQQQQQQTSESQLSQSTQNIQMPSLTTSMFTSSADFFRNLQTQSLLVQPPPYDMPVDTNSYILGPGDIVNVGIWGATPLSLSLSVNPEGTLIVPTFGELRIGGMTLSKAKAYARERLGTQFKKSTITLTLIYPKSFYVMISGRVHTPGRYIVTAFDRVDRAFVLANLPRSTADTAAPFPDFSLRRIELLHKDGASENVDLLKFYMTGNLSDDPYLREGDAIVVPKENFEAGSISISGAVKMPGNYEYVPGDRIKDLLELCAGHTSLADTAHAKILSWNGKTYDVSDLNLDDSSAVYAPLPVNSRVIVPTDRSKINDYYVWVGGEVQTPGIYPISRDSTRLSTIINLAGGFTKWASLPNAFVYRRTHSFPSRQSVILDTLSYTYRATGVSLEDLSYLTSEILLRPTVELVSTDFVKVFVNKDEDYDCTLRSGDSIYVPKSPNAIYVFGRVRNPGYVDYHEGWDYADYIKAAGGAGDDAKTGDTKIIKSETHIWYDKSDTKIEAGDLLFIPKVTVKPELYTWDMFKDILAVAGAAASIVTTVVLVIRTAQGK
ncbi:MAG TPA: SLBB domain-containing protein [Candidatus Acidoferrales bacterium]|nr:SLBB domain-containing protein [Candidatus Acidoferrales bacterium]